MGSEEEVRGERANGFAGRLEVIEGPSGSRSWSDAVKAQIVRESLEPGVTVSEVARCHRISPQHLTLWRRAVREGRLLVPIGCDKNGGDPFVPLAVEVDRGEARSS